MVITKCDNKHKVPSSATRITITVLSNQSGLRECLITRHEHSLCISHLRLGNKLPQNSPYRTLFLRIRNLDAVQLGGLALGLLEAAFKWSGSKSHPRLDGAWGILF